MAGEVAVAAIGVPLISFSTDHGIPAAPAPASPAVVLSVTGEWPLRWPARLLSPWA